VQNDSEDPDSHAAWKSLSAEQATGNASRRSCAKGEESGRQVERASDNAAHKNGAKKAVALGSYWEGSSGHVGPLQTRI
jgi:hypothetical protein